MMTYVKFLSGTYPENILPTSSFENNGGYLYFISVIAIQK